VLWSIELHALLTAVVSALALALGLTLRGPAYMANHWVCMQLSHLGSAKRGCVLCGRRCFFEIWKFPFNRQYFHFWNNTHRWMITNTKTVVYTKNQCRLSNVN
jgi:hypothetical protein